MPIVDFTNVVTLLLAVVLFVLILYLGKETHKSWLLAVMLMVFLGLLIGHTAELVWTNNLTEMTRASLVVSILLDFTFIFISFISYRWIDDIQAKIENKKSIDDSLSWFWSTSSNKETKKVAKKA